MATSRHAPPKLETALYEKRGPICFITLNRPEKLRGFVNERQRQFHLYTQGRGLHLTEDFRESAATFVEKRTPAFKGR